MKKIRFLLFFLLSITALHAQNKLSNEAEISILTSTPSEEEVFTVYGHTAIRINDPIHNFDYIFNYGIFDFNKPNFIYRFAKGETDYMLGVDDFQHYIIGYQLRGSGIIEQVLNLTTEEKEKIWTALEINYRPENRIYRYNFFFDNCSTRPVVLVEKNVTGEVVYDYPYPPQTFRDLINACTENKPWQTFGCDLALGSSTDRMATQHEEMFLPLYLMEAFENAFIKSEDGSTRKLVKQTNIIVEDISDEEDIKSTFFTPLIVCWGLFLFILLLTIFEWKKKIYYPIIDFMLFFVAGIAGVVLFFLAFISEHPGTTGNWLLLWLNPIHLFGAILFMVKKAKKAAYYYHFINFAVLTLMLLFWRFIPQHFNAAFIPLVSVIWVRSAYSVYRYKSGFR